MFSTMKFNKENLKEVQNVEVELPVLNKFLLCLPLRPGLTIWGYIQLLAIIVISWIAIVDFAEKANHMSGFRLVQAVIMFMILMTVSLLEVLNCLFLIMGAMKKNTNFLEVCYHYLKVKIFGYTGLLIFSILLSLFVHCDSWYYYNLDPWRFITLMDNQAMGVIDIVLQFYLLLLVRSEIIKLEHSIELNNLYQRFRSDPMTVLTHQPQVATPTQENNLWCDNDNPIKIKLEDSAPAITEHIITTPSLFL